MLVAGRLWLGWCLLVARGGSVGSIGRWRLYSAILTWAFILLAVDFPVPVPCTACTLCNEKILATHIWLSISYIVLGGF